LVISEKRHAELYNSIYAPIMDLRVKNSMGMSSEELDSCLYDLNEEIYARIRSALDLHKA
jgi:hypothetical protein